MPIKMQDRLVGLNLIREPEEIEYYSDIVTRYHYLGSSEINRNTIVHVAKRRGELLGIVTWEPGVRRWFGLRDRVIGWSKEQKTQRLKYCVENRRFLLLKKEANLASKVLGLSAARLNQDGKRMFGHEFMLAETFVDPSQGYDGTCYKAAGWSEVGLTQGGRGPNRRSKKLYFIKELQKQALGKLKAPEFTASDVKRPKSS